MRYAFLALMLAIFSWQLQCESPVPNKFGTIGLTAVISHVSESAGIGGVFYFTPKMLLGASASLSGEALGSLDSNKWAVTSNNFNTNLSLLPCYEFHPFENIYFDLGIECRYRWDFTGNDHSTSWGMISNFTGTIKYMFTKSFGLTAHYSGLGQVSYNYYADPTAQGAQSFATKVYGPTFEGLGVIFFFK